MACDPARITGSCAECQRTKLAGSDFVLGDLEDFLAAERGVHAAQFTDVRAGARATGATEVYGPTLRCRDCVVASRDAADAARGTAWRAEAASITFTALPLGLKPHAAFPAAYIVEAVSAGKPAAALGVAAGWRVRNVGGRDCRGEAVGAVRALLKRAPPLVVEFDTPVEAWAPCVDCGTVSAGLRGRLCALCADERRFQTQPTADAADASADAPGAAADSWEDL